MNIFCYCQQAEDGDGGPEREDPPQNASFKTSQIRQMFLVCKVSRWASVSQTQYISNLQKRKVRVCVMPNSIEHNIGVLSIKMASASRRCLGHQSKGNRSFDGQSPVLGSSQRAQPPHQLAGTEHQQGLQGNSPGAQVHRSGHNHVV